MITKENLILAAAVCLALIALRGSIQLWSRRKGHPEKPARSFGTKLLTGVVAAIVLAATGVIAIVVVGTQVGFYRSEMRVKTVDLAPLPWHNLDLAVFTPLATESITWVCTLMAVVLIVRSKKAARWLRAMWLFASISAFVNFVHATVLNHDVLGGVVTGGLSIALPYTVHLFVLWVRQLKSGRTEDQDKLEAEIRWATIGRIVRTIALTILDHLVHPLTALRTIWVWRAYRGMSYGVAWFVASAPLRVGVRERYTTPPKKRAQKATEPVQDTPETGVHTEPMVPCVDRADDVPYGDVLTAVRVENDPERAELEALLSYFDDPHGFEDDVKKLSEEMRAQGVISGNTEKRTRRTDSSARTSDAVQKPTVRRAPKPKRTPVKRTRTGLKKAGRTSARDQITAEFWRRKHAGEDVDPGRVDFAAMARDMATSRTTVSKTWKDCLAGKRPDPGQQQDTSEGNQS